MVVASRGQALVTMTCSVRGPCTPSTRLSSMSLVALGPEIHREAQARVRLSLTELAR